MRINVTTYNNDFNPSESSENKTIDIENTVH